ncbi:MAG: N-acetylmuramoyl-L-alanine amidase [Rhizobiales bacterium]|nr:N-acetylmuramoyl-L-alanine amidase [Hyphomicrobiales bacterium]
MAFSLTWLPDVLRNAGLKVAEQPGWASRGRGEMQTVQGIVCHHTATASQANMPTLRMLTDGRSDLPGPLAQLGLARDGTYYVIAAGIANHAGSGRWKGFGGNSRFIGIEAENAGTAADPWPDVQMDSYRRGVAAILKRLGLGADRCCGHKEYAPDRKVDPLFDMNLFRREVAAIMPGVAVIRPLIPATESASGRPTIRRGARGPLVGQMQQKLNIEADGVFGPSTEAAVRQFQRQKGLVPDGIIGPKTWTVILALP